jgi:glyoxylase-like metal-dependent hydrolase (beta-lactamase superfamily II)
MSEPIIHPIDLNFLGRKGTIAAYLVPHSTGGLLVETGPHSTIQNLVAGLKNYGVQVENITDVFLTHIHLDHAGAAGWWAQQGARIHVHENGAPHLINPEKFLASAGRLYGSLMDSLWGEFIPVSQDQLTVMHDQEVTQVGDLTIRALDVPGHANHHLAYLIGDACFSGDIAGIRLSSYQYLRLPMPPPDFHLEKWQESVRHIQQARPKRIIPTHFGIYSDAEWHLQAVLEDLDAVKNWMEAILPLDLSQDELHQKFIEFEHERAQKNCIPKEVEEGQHVLNPSFMSADGILRYWKKYRTPT